MKLAHVIWIVRCRAIFAGPLGRPEMFHILNATVWPHGGRGIELVIMSNN